jgi:hypothetical protein
LRIAGKITQIINTINHTAVIIIIIVVVRTFLFVCAVPVIFHLAVDAAH